jgi:ArsR family transcriptional regulator, arsenate/arsenite/antimonite-responsive transcriptional repressor
MGEALLRIANTKTTEECDQGAESCTEAPDLPRQLKALSEPTRLRIVDLLMEGVQCNCEIAQRLDLSYSLISHHMRVLRLAGLVQSEQSPDDERWVYYSVDLEATERLLEEMQRLLNPNRLQSRSPACGPQSKGCSS